MEYCPLGFAQFAYLAPASRHEECSQFERDSSKHKKETTNESTQCVQLVSRAMGAFLIGGCSSIERVSYPNSADPKEEVSRIEEQFLQNEVAQTDVLAPRDYEGAVRHFNSAKRELADTDMDDFWDELGTSKAYLDRAGNIAAERGVRVQAALTARQKAIDAGARRFESTQKALHEIDESFKANANSLDKERVNGEVWERAVVQYGALQLNSIREANLGETKSLVRTAKDRGARTYAPKTLQETEDVIARAERAIADQPENAAAYTPLANRAGELARYLLA